MSTGIHIENCVGVIVRGNPIRGYDVGVAAVGCRDVAIEENPILDRPDVARANDKHGIVEKVKNAFAAVSVNAAGSTIGNLLT